MQNTLFLCGSQRGCSWENDKRQIRSANGSNSTVGFSQASPLGLALQGPASLCNKVLSITQDRVQLAEYLAPCCFIDPRGKPRGLFKHNKVTTPWQEYVLQLTMAGQSSFWSCASRLEQTLSKFTSGGHVYSPALCTELFASRESGFDDCLDLATY